jgi:hypothetical protein
MQWIYSQVDRKRWITRTGDRPKLGGQISFDDIDGKEKGEANYLEGSRALGTGVALGAMVLAANKG